MQHWYVHILTLSAAACHSNEPCSHHCAILSLFSSILSAARSCIWSLRAWWQAISAEAVISCWPMFATVRLDLVFHSPSPSPIPDPSDHPENPKELLTPRNYPSKSIMDDHQETLNLVEAISLMTEELKH